jgi:hydroxypyruvate isomerase
MITQALAEFDESRVMIANVKAYGKFTLAVDGIGKVEEAHKQVKRLRIDITKRGKELRDDATKYSRAIIEEEKRLVSEVEPIEAALWGQRQIHEAAELERQKAKQAEKRKVLTDRIERLAQAGCIAGDVAAIEQMNDDEFSLHFICEKMKAETLREQAEAARLEAEKFEADRLAEVARQAEELRVRREELEAERQAMAAEREAMLHQQQIERKSLEVQQAELNRQHEAIRFNEERKAEEERQAALLIRRQEDERLAKIAADEAKAARVARMEALKPEIEKAETFANRLMVHSVEILRVMDQPHWSVDAMESVRRCGLEVLAIARGEA